MSKRLIALVSVVMLITALLPLTGATALIGPQYVSTANGKGLYLRTAPSTSADIILTIPFGAMVDSYEYYDNSWGYVSYNGNYGYAMSRYFSSEKPSYRPSPNPTRAPSGGGGSATGNMFNGFVKTSYYASVKPSTPSGFVNLRWAPSKNQAIEGTYYAGYSLKVLATNGTWSQVLDESTGTCGFMMSGFLSELSVGSYGSDS